MRGFAAPDRKFELEAQRSSSPAGCSVWWRDVPSHGDQRLGLIGNFRAQSLEEAAEVLECACQELRRRGCNLAVAPIDGSTWGSYRTVVDWGDEPGFFMEPQTPREWPAFFWGSGFRPWLHYFSAVDSRLTRPDPLAEELADSMQRRGVGIRPIDLSRFDGELARLHALAVVCFQHHDLYRDIDLNSFLRIYRPLAGAIDPQLVLIAERQGRPVGFLFAVPDFLESARGQPLSTAVVKSIGVLPERMFSGLGYHLLAELRRRAVERGYRRCIYGMMREGGYLQRRITAFARPIRRYAVFAKELR